MKRGIMFLVIFFAAINICISQTITPNNHNEYKAFGILYVLNLANGRTVQTENLIINKDEIVSVVRLTRFETIEKYGQITKSGAFVLAIKPNISFWTLSQIFDQFKIIDEYRQLPVYIDESSVDRPQTLIAQRSMIVSVTVLNDKKTSKKSINIKTTDRSKKGNSNLKYPEFYLQGSEILAVDSILNSNK